MNTGNFSDRYIQTVEENDGETIPMWVAMRFNPDSIFGKIARFIFKSRK